MRRKAITILLTVGCLFLSIPQSHADPITIIIKTAVTKVLKALDLAVQKLQTATIKLQNIQKGLENLMSKLKLDEIYEWTEKQRSLFAGYYEELYKVKSYILYYKRTRDIVQDQLKLVEEYKRAIALFNKDKNFNAKELKFIADVYLGILEESVKNADQIVMVINAFSTQMTDAQRLEIISNTSKAVNKNLSDLRRFTNGNIVLSLQRAKETNEVDAVKKLYGITE